MRNPTFKRIIRAMLPVLLVGVVVPSTGCQADENSTGATGQKSMDESKNRSQKDINNVLAYRTSLDTAFEDEQLRSLAAAGKSGDIGAIDRLIDAGADVNGRGASGVTALFWALGNFAGFEHLLKSGADPNLTFADSSVLHWATELEDTRFLKTALQAGGNPDLRAGDRGETPVFALVTDEESASLEVIDVLLAAGADINAELKYETLSGTQVSGFTALMRAAQFGKYQRVHDLLVRKADYTIKDQRGNGLVEIIVDQRKRGILNKATAPQVQRVIAWLKERGITVPE